MLSFNQSFTFVTNLLLVAVITVSMSFTTGQAIHLDLPSLIPVMTAIYLQAIGLGFMLAGLALIYKRIQAFFQIVQFALVGILFIPLDAFPLARYLPLAAGHRIMQKVLMDGQRLWQVGWGEGSSMLIATAVYLGAGIACFALAESKARSRGLLGQY
jgi:ABC-2 type transport system permease protein